MRIKHLALTIPPRRAIESRAYINGMPHTGICIAGLCRLTYRVSVRFGRIAFLGQVIIASADRERQVWTITNANVHD
ncbi:MAG: hypothetical protein ACK5TK_00295 [Betaproteobacteria bacterium]